jgi:hypothetical protein
VNRNITFNLDDSLIHDAKQVAQAHGISLNQQVSQLLSDLTKEYRHQTAVAKMAEAMSSMRGKIVLDKMPTRDEMNER